MKEATDEEEVVFRRADHPSAENSLAVALAETPAPG